MKRIPINHLCIITLFWVFFTLILIKIMGPDVGDRELSDLVTSGLAYNILLAALTVLLYSVFRPSHKLVGLNRVKTGRNWIMYYPIFVIALGVLSGFLNGAFQDIHAYGWVLINCLFVGISEELMFRGIMLSSLTKKLGFWKAAIIVILLFGLIHILNVFVTGNLGQGLLQAFAAMCSGILFLAIRVRTLSIVPAIILHWLWDFNAFRLEIPSGDIDTTNYLSVLTLGVGLLVSVSPLIFGITGIIQLTKKDAVEAYIKSQNIAE